MKIHYTSFSSKLFVLFFNQVKSSKEWCHIPPDASTILKYLLNATKQHAKHGLLNVLMTMNGWCQRLCQLLKYILNNPDIRPMMDP